jgi:hypothetical protein
MTFPVSGWTSLRGGFLDSDGPEGVEPSSAGTQNTQAGTVPQAHKDIGQQLNRCKVALLAFCFQSYTCIMQNCIELVKLEM